MKKILFVALMLTEFCFANNTIKKNETAVVEYDCVDEWEKNFYNLTENWGATDDEAFAIADRLFDKCLDEVYGVDNTVVTPPVLTPNPPKGLSPL